eukprot:gnl/TRDRNA2_/TRDRNA2_97243_c0_seq2.p1 gnl/TRDRNA2_/TRDRNA2_97243_c0~~gnl/TRDRNA2_/TRDRNA2_97243_c0_seq2.p1  ORF type:complete len:330 (-),score=46.06 gnl/TRDRNA2_/TRDRNA2_97243_c0_seq2:64-1053(-)
MRRVKLLLSQCLIKCAAHALSLLLAGLCSLTLVQAEEEPDCENLPGGCRCYYDALADGCPASLGRDGQIAMCFCDYRDNTWLNVLSNFMWAFKQGQFERYRLADKFAVKLEDNGLLSMDVGYTQRVQCGAPLAQVYPGTMFQADVDELHKFARNLFWPQVRVKLQEICLPGRIALQLLCLHAELGRRDGWGAQAYARQLQLFFPLMEGCAEKQTPWPFPGLGDYVRSWNHALVPPDGSLISVEVASSLSWWPDPELMRGKLPHESDGHYWPCAPLQDRSCFPTGTENLYMSCEYCCDPAKGPTGEAACFGGDWTFTRCCRTPGDSGRFY